MKPSILIALIVTMAIATDAIATEADPDNTVSEKYQSLVGTWSTDIDATLERRYRELPGTLKDSAIERHRDDIKESVTINIHQENNKFVISRKGELSEWIFLSDQSGNAYIGIVGMSQPILMSVFIEGENLVIQPTIVKERAESVALVLARGTKDQVEAARIARSKIPAPESMIPMYSIRIKIEEGVGDTKSATDYMLDSYPTGTTTAHSDESSDLCFLTSDPDVILKMAKSTAEYYKCQFAITDPQKVGWDEAVKLFKGFDAEEIQSRLSIFSDDMTGGKD